MKKISASKKALCFLLTTFLMIASVSFPSLSLNTVDISEESTEFSEQNVDTTDFIDLNSVLAENSIGSVGINNGDYYIINVISKKFLENDGDLTVSVASLWDHVDISWTFENLGSGDYCIRDPLNNNLAMFAIGDEVELGNAGSSPSPYYRWNILLAENGECIIKNKGSDSVLRFDGGSISLDWEPDSNNENYAQYTWRLFEDDTYIDFIDHRYDQGYSARFAAMDTDTENLIRNYHYETARRLLDIFNVAILGTYTSCTSIADECKLQTGSISASTCDNPCFHANQSCIDRDVLATTLPYGTNISCHALWTGHILKDDEPSAFYWGWEAMIISPCVTSRYHPETQSDIIIRETIYTLTHETSHQLGAHDHYCYGKNGEDSCINQFCDECTLDLPPRACLMSYRYNIDDLSDEEMYCDDCVYTITAHLAAHH